MPETPAFSWHGRKVFLTGHTGFKGGWLALWLAAKGAQVRGYALDPATEPNLFAAARVGSVIEDIRGDIRNPAALEPALRDFAPEVVFHLAAQPLVRLSYEDPILTYETNVLGTARVLDAVRRAPSARAVVSVTTDKCYENKEWIWPYRETDPLGGYDPYSSSKACAELVSAAYRQSFFSSAKQPVALATSRAGNVIGGGDWSPDRLVPDLIRGFLSGEPVRIRRPHAIRPWQHVLEPLQGYIRLAERLLSPNPAPFATAYNFGPSDDDARCVAWIANKMTLFWEEDASWIDDSPDESLDDSAADSPHEAHYLKLDASRAKSELGWTPHLNLETALEWLVRWYRAHQSGVDMHSFTLAQIAAYEAIL
jgi:CDP-glucose 4,6-dehydratase